MEGSDPMIVESKLWMLKKEEELRFEINEEDDKVIFRLEKGNAEIFGSEMAFGHDYKLSKCKLAIFTWHGCYIRVTGTLSSIYTASETPMLNYLNIHSALEERRKLAKNKGTTGPILMIVAPQDSGKSSLMRVLLSYAVRAGWKPTAVDLDVGRNLISIPGSLSATSIEHPVGMESKFTGFGIAYPLVYFFGHISPRKNVPLYQNLVEHLSEVVEKRCETSKEAGPSGVIINTSGWVDDFGYDLLIHSANTFKVDVMICLGHEKLYSKLKQDTKLKNVIVAKLPKSGGVVVKRDIHRRSERMNSIRHYFYGPEHNLSPHSRTIHFDSIHIYRLGGGLQVPSSALPIGTNALVDPDRVSKVNPNIETDTLKHAILAVSYATNEKNLMEANTAGFIYVSKVDSLKKTLTVLTPYPGPLPSSYLLIGTIKWFD